MTRSCLTARRSSAEGLGRTVSGFRARSALVAPGSIRIQPHIETAFARSSGEGRLGLHLSSICRLTHRAIKADCHLAKNSPSKFHLLQNVHGCRCSVRDLHWSTNTNWNEAAVSHRRGRNLSTPPTRLTTSADQPDPHGFEFVHSSG